jgi:uncharacterized Zn finger protein
MEYQALERQIWYKCQNCSFQRFGKNILSFEDMILIKECQNCGGNWKFKCLECGMANKTKKIELPVKS